MSRVNLSSRERRFLAATIAGLTALAIVVEVVRPNPVRGMTLSAYPEQEGSDHTARLAHDGRDESPWLAPIGAKGTLVVRFDEPRNLRAVRIVNARDDKHHHGTRELVVDFFAGDRVLETKRLVLELEGAPSTVSVTLQGVTSVRFRVESWYGIGGGLGEVGFVSGS